MKINKTNPKHWLYLVLFGINVMLAMVMRRLISRKGITRVVFYGHKLNGNLLAIHRWLCTTRNPDLEVAFLTMDPAYHKELSAQGTPCLLAISPHCIPWLAAADAVVSDHGLHVLQLMLGRTKLKFFDVWHGIPFKGFDAEDFHVQHRYDEIWVASSLMARMYVERYGFDAERVKVTGYARTDCLVRRDEDIEAIKQRLGLDGVGVGKIVLFAPTWKQDVNQRSIFPFGVGEHEFFHALSELARQTDSTFVMRAHLNSRSEADQVWERIVQRPHAFYPDTEELLLVSDILVCDWSSIAFDYLLLDRPTVFLDVPPPFSKGFSLGAEYRYGSIVSSMQKLLETLESYLKQPRAYQLAFGERAGEVREAVYGDNASGMSAANCVARLRRQLHCDDR